MSERISNLNEYHDVIAESLRQITGNTVAGKEEIVRELCISNILQAYTIYVSDTPEEYKKLETELEDMQTNTKTKSAQIYDVIAKRLQQIGIYTKEGNINTELPLDRLKIIMYYYQAKIGVKPTQTTRQITRIYDRVRGELSMP